MSEKLTEFEEKGLRALSGDNMLTAAGLAEIFWPDKKPRAMAMHAATIMKRLQKRGLVKTEQSYRNGPWYWDITDAGREAIGDEAEDDLATLRSTLATLAKINDTITSLNGSVKALVERCEALERRCAALEARTKPVTNLRFGQQN